MFVAVDRLRVAMLTLRPNHLTGLLYGSIKDYKWVLWVLEALGSESYHGKIPAEDFKINIVSECLNSNADSSI